MTGSRVEKWGLRALAALLWVSAIIVVWPLLYALLLLDGESATEPATIWFGVWALASIGLAVFNGSYGFEMIRSPRRKIVLMQATGAALAIATCPFVAMLFID